MTPAEGIYDIRMTLAAGKLSDDSNLEDEQVLFWMDSQRAFLTRNNLQKGQAPDTVMIQDLGCVEIEIVDRAECCSIATGCDFIRTKLEVPRPIEIYSGPVITRVAPVDKLAKAFSFVDMHRVIFSGNSRFNKNELFAFYKDNRVYIKIVPGYLQHYALQYINIQGIFERPSDVGSFKRCDGTPCYTIDSQYPMPQYMMEIMKSNIVNSNYKLLYGPMDTSNDASGQPTTRQV